MTLYLVQRLLLVVPMFLGCTLGRAITAFDRAHG